MTTNSRPPHLTVLAFDAYGTLFDVFSVTALCEDFFPARGTALSQLWRAKQLHYTLLCSLMGRHRNFWHLTEDALVYACRSLSLELPADRRQRLMNAYLRLDAFPDARPVLERLKDQGMRLAILSNGEPQMLQAATNHARIAPLLDAIISVEDVGVFKPSPRVYNLVSERLCVATRHIGFVSSNSWDVAGAASAGLTTFWVRRAGAEPEEELGFPATHVVGALTEVPALLQR
ncbi:MAG TPA: haloacid dehalogenase type II [Gemmatimonadales bacterium]|nr:haloacid dehalogenase type II [Gemmatimonadales bacterium]